MSDVLCFNCGQPGHKSANCPEPQKKSRCPSCDKVNGHSNECQNFVFTSQSRFTSTTVFAMQNMLKMEFKNVNDCFVVQDVDRQVEIGSVALWLSTIDAFVGKSGKFALDFATSRPIKRHITIVNNDNKPVLSLVFYEKVLKINSRFELNEKGDISFNRNAVNAIMEKVVCKIKICNYADVFGIRITWYGHKHVFDVYPLVGPILVDPLQPQQAKQQQKAAEQPHQPKMNVSTIDVRVNAAFGREKIDSGACVEDNFENRTFTLNLDLSDIEQSIFEMEIGLANVLRSAARNIENEERRAIEAKKRRTSVTTEIIFISN